MKTASAVYKILQAIETSSYEWRVIQGENTYELDKLRSMTVSYALTTNSGIDIGNANSAECRMTLLEESANWQRMADFTIQFRILLGNTISEWITLGTFYTDERSEDKYGNLSIIAFDAMLKMEQSWTDKIPDELLPASFPITAKAWATMIQSAGLATFADLTQLDDTVAFVGLDTTSTIRDVLKTIAAVHGGNWMVTPSETLNLIQFVNVDPEETSTYFDLQSNVQSLEDSPALDAVTGVHLETEAGTVMEDGGSSGYVVKAICDVSTTTGIAELCLSRVEDYVFQPFEVGIGYLDPRADVGDSVKIGNTIYHMMSIDWTIGKKPTANISAPYDNEIDHEYTVPSQEAKNYRKTVKLVNDQMDDYVPWDEVSTAIQQNAESVVIAASGTYVTQTVYNEQIAEIQSQLDGSIQTWSGNAVPTLNNAPAVDWNTPGLKAEHVGDTYFVNSDAGIPEAGNYYRFENNNGVYSWQLLTDTALTEALAQAAAAQAAAAAAQSAANAANTTAQSKGRIFVVQPTPPYDVGDLWFNSTDSVIKVCMTARASGSFVDTDWVKRDNYADYNELDEWLSEYSSTIQSIINQVDQKAETYYQSADPAISWGAHPAGIAIAGVDIVGVSAIFAQAHEGDLWYRTTDNTTWYWDGTKWIQQDVPDDVFDMIDGKAQIFVTQPTNEQEYDIGDLWVNATYGDLYSNDVLRCLTAKPAGDPFSINHWQKASKYTDDSALSSFVNSIYNPEIAAIQSNLDGKVDTYFYNYAPTLSNAPANAWTTTDLKNSHLDDLFYNTTTGYTYRFTKSGSTYSWARIKDSDITTAMSTASTAKDTADGKRRVFVAQPTNAQAYDVGDLWANATYGTTYSNDLLKCKTAKAAGAAFNIAHWEKASKYTDDSALNEFTRVTYTSDMTVMSNKISARVQKDQGSTRTTFGWVLNETAHTWYANDAEVMKVNRNGLYVTGSITATSGYIGTSQSGFEIGANYIRNGMLSRDDTSRNGIFLGTNGIALGAGKFKVTDLGEITATSGTIGGLTLSSSAMYTNGQSSYSGTGNGIYIGTSGLRLGSKFSVSTSGDVTMNNLTANNAVLKGTLTIYNNSGTSYNTIGSGDLYTGAYQSASNYSNWNGTYSTVNTNGGNWTSAYNSACVSGGYSYDGATQGYSYQSATNYNTSNYPTYFTCGTLFAKSGISANGNILCTNYDVYCDELRASSGIQVAYGSSYYTAAWKSTSGSMNYTHVYKVYDINGAEHWTGDLGTPAVNVSPQWVLGL